MIVQNELPADGNRVTYNMSEESQPTLRINDLRESDGRSYCCEESVKLCWQNAIQLNVSDLQVMVFPTTEGQSVTLMCSTSCPLTENPAAYIWYRNREFLYEDWSPWYQELVNSDETVTYSCAIKGYEDLRAPNVSVDSVTSTCFKVTYAGGRMCSHWKKSEDEPCSITYPSEVFVQPIPIETLGRVTLTCSTNCTLTTTQPAYTWYRNRCKYFESHHLVCRTSLNASISCAVKGLEQLHSAEVCVADKNCWTVNYPNRRICALKSSSVNILGQYSHPKDQQPKSKSWYKKSISGEGQAKKLKEIPRRVEYRDKVKNHHSLWLNNLQQTDSAEYTFRLQKDNDECKSPELPGVTLIVTDLKVKLHPEVVTEGQRVTLTCSTSCPLSGDTTYIWFLNGQPLTLPENQSKQLVLDPVNRQHAGYYSCAVESGKRNISSTDKALTVLRITGDLMLAAAAGAGAALLVIIPLTVLCCIRIRRRKTSSKPPRPPRASQNKDQLNSSPLYENISAQPKEQDDHHYSRLVFSRNHTEDLYSTIESVSSR
ncbi:uncharacterized protein LOC113162600 isoform X2 [Anabas testudineus]|nr:uncharacterized protein LOC113162600 isoform X2 [Anabas testudineus]